MDSEERIIKVMNHEETDRIPVFEWMLDSRVINGLCPGLSSDEFIYKMNLDAICVDLNYQRNEIRPGVFIDEWGLITKLNSEEKTHPVIKPIMSMRDLKNYIPPDPHKAFRYKTLEEKIMQNNGKKAIILHLNDVFTIPLKLMGFQELIIAFWNSPKLVSGLIELSVEINLELAREAVKRGVKIIYTSDDYAYNTGPIISVENFSKYLYPALCRIINGYKKLGLYIIKRTGGNIMPIIDLIIASGIDCLDGIDPQAGMSLEFIKKKYGRAIALKGNIDCGGVLSYGSREQVIEETKKCINIGGQGGGYILSSSNCIHSGVIPENYSAMLETHRKFGNYI